MELKNVFESFNKKLSEFNETASFTLVKDSGVKATDISVFTEDDIQCIKYSGKNGSYKIMINSDTDILTLECSADNGDDAEYREMFKSLLSVSSLEDRDIKSSVNEILEELKPLYLNKKKDLSKVKLPKSASKSAIKNGTVSYNDVDLAAKFADNYSELKDVAKQIIVDYNELLPETFFVAYGTPFVIDMLKSKDDVKLKKLFKFLNDVYENGTNAAQDVIAVTILGQLYKEPGIMETADLYMCDYMKTPVHEVNKIMSKKSIISKLTNPPPYKPKKEKKGMMSSLMTGGQPQR